MFPSIVREVVDVSNILFDHDPKRGSYVVETWWNTTRSIRWTIRCAGTIIDEHHVVSTHHPVFDLLVSANAPILSGPPQSFHIDRRMPLQRQTTAAHQSVDKWRLSRIKDPSDGFPVRLTAYGAVPAKLQRVSDRHSRLLVPLDTLTQSSHSLAEHLGFWLTRYACACAATSRLHFGTPFGRRTAPLTNLDLTCLVRQKSGDTQAQEVVLALRFKDAAARRLAACAAAVPTPAAKRAVRAVGRTNRITNRFCPIVTTPILAPLPYVPVHVI